MKVIQILFRALFVVALVTVISLPAHAQSQKQGRAAQDTKDPASAEQGNNSTDSKIMVGSPEAEMLARRDVKAAEKEHQENLERAREAAQLSTEIRDSFLNNKALGRNEVKKLERLEKITRKIRSEAGGSDGDATLEYVPMELEPSLSRLAEISDKMRKGVEKTPRQVVSASVIERANEVLEIIRYLRSLPR